MNYVPYVSFKNHRLTRVGCMKCNKFLYDFSDAVSLKDAERLKLPHRVPLALSDGSRTDMVLCHECDVMPADIPMLELTMKRAWLVEFIQAGRPRELILQLARRIKTLKILGRCNELSIHPS